MGKGSNTTSTASSSTSAPDAQAGQAYRDILQRAEGVAATPYQAYTGDLTADVNSQQTAGIAGINANANFASPYLQQASQQASSASAPITAGQIQGYLNPYTQSVVDATTSQLQHDNSQQMAQLQGNQISQGALGGNATGVAKGVLAGQQDRTMASTTAGLYQQGYTQALQAAQQQQQTGLAGANAQANYGISGQGAALQGAGAQIAAGGLQQTTDQANLDRMYQQYAQAQAYPYQQTQWLAGVATGVGSNLGGTSSGTGSTTAPAPNQTAQYLGLGLSAASLLSDRDAKDHISRIGKMNDGTPIYRFRYKGDDQWHVGPMAQDVERRNPDAVERGLGGLRYIDLKAATDDSAARRATGGGVGGTPWAGAQGWIPTMNIHGGSGAPSSHGSAPSVPQQPAQDFSKLGAGISGLGSSKLAGQIGQFFNPEAYGNSMGGGDGVYGGSSSAPLPGLDPLDYGEGFARGGGVAGVADWQEPQGMFGEGDGAPDTFSDRFAGDGGGSMGQMSRGVGLAHYMRDPSATIATNDFQTAGSVNPDEPVRLQGSTFGPEAPQATPVVNSDDDDEEAPVGVAGRAGRTAPVMAFGANNPYGATPDATSRPAEEERSGFGLLPISKNAGAGLLTAGLGMLASRSPFLGTAVGEGGLAGVAAYGAANEHDRKVAAEAAKLSTEARQQFIDNTFKANTQAETSRHNKATEAKEFKPTWGQVDEDPITGRKIMGWIDPNKKTTSVPGAPAAGGTGAPAAQPKPGGIPLGLTGKEYMDELEKQNPEFARTAKAVGDYRASVASLSQRGGLRERIMNAALRYNPEYDQAHYGEKTRALGVFAAGPEGRATRSLNVSIDHLDTLREAGDALKNGDLPALNRIVNYMREKTGSPLTTNFDSIKQVVSSEIAKAVVGGQTAIHDRDDMAQRAANSTSPAQMNGIIEQFQKLMAGQMKGLRRQYEATTRLKNFDDYLEPGTKRVLGSLEHKEPAAGAGAGAGGFTPPPGALERLYNGKKYYYDPATKQPYPGQ